MNRDLADHRYEAGEAAGEGEAAPDADEHVKPYVHEDQHLRSMQFSILELQSRMDLREPDALDLAYTRVMMGFLLFNSAPGSILMIGLGGGSLAKFCHRHLPDARITAVEINPHVIALRDRFLVPPDGERFSVVEAEGAGFVRDITVPVDVLMVDGFDYDGQPAALCSQAFYDDAAAALSPDGLLVVNLHAGHHEHETYLRRIARSFGTAVLEVTLMDEGNSVVFAARRAGLIRPVSVLRRPASLSLAAWAPLKAALGRVAEAARLQQKGEGG